MSTWAPNVSIIQDNGFGSSRGGEQVVGAITHHVAGRDGRRYVAESNSRNSHPTYHIGQNGVVTGIVHPDRRPSSTGGSIDKSCITVEIDNTGGGPDWPVSQAALDAWAVIIRHHAAESPRAGKAIVKNIPGQRQEGFFVGWHGQYVQTECPGQYVRSHLGGVIARANGSSVPAGNGSSPAWSGSPAPLPASGVARTSTQEDGVTGPIFNQRLQLWGRLYGGYTGPLDGVMGVNSFKAMQTNLAREYGYTGPIDGIPGINTWKAVQRWAARYGYTGPIDGVPGKNTWRAVAKALNTL